VNSSVGLFLQGSYKITPELTLTVGGRYTWDKRRVTFSSVSTNLLPAGALNADGTRNLFTGPAGSVFCGISRPDATVTNPPRSLVPLANCEFTNRAKFDKPSYNIGLEYESTRDNLFYIVHRQGYRTGGLNQRAATIEELQSPFGPETVRDVEIGTKNTFRFDDDSELRVNVAGYYLWYSDIQRLIQRLESGLLFNTILNAGKAHIKGVEADVSYVPVPGLTISASYAYSKATYDSFTVGGLDFSGTASPMLRSTRATSPCGSSLRSSGRSARHSSSSTPPRRRQRRTPTLLRLAAAWAAARCQTPRSGSRMWAGATCRLFWRSRTFSTGSMTSVGWPSPPRLAPSRKLLTSWAPSSAPPARGGR
jgi:outer membrane receptor protein involved in Fe transport